MGVWAFLTLARYPVPLLLELGGQEPNRLLAIRALGGELEGAAGAVTADEGAAVRESALDSSNEALGPASADSDHASHVTGDDGAVEGESRLEGRAVESHCSSVVERFGAMNAGLNCNLYIE